MKEKLKKLFAYYGPYKKLFYSDMFFAILGAAVTLIIPLVVRYITNEVVYFDAAGARASVLKDRKTFPGSHEGNRSLSDH